MRSSKATSTPPMHHDAREARCQPALWLLTACLALVPISPVRAVTGPAAVAQLNLQRDANGLPGDLVERPDWTAACAQHNEYMRLNNVVEHSETPGNPGYSTEGAWAAGSANLGGGSWAADRNPWDNAPIHLMQLLSPKLAQLGASDARAMSAPPPGLAIRARYQRNPQSSHIRETGQPRFRLRRSLLNVRSFPVIS
jgi:hypothetical protein